jgi:hypothetical protein
MVFNVLLPMKRLISTRRKNQNSELCKLAVQQNGLALQYVKNQNEEICKLAV